MAVWATFRRLRTLPSVVPLAVFSSCGRPRPPRAGVDAGVAAITVSALGFGELALLLPLPLPLLLVFRADVVAVQLEARV